MKLCEKGIRGTLMVAAWGIVIEYSKIGAGDEPEIIRFARMDAGRVVILRAVGGDGEERIVDVRTVGRPEDAGRPTGPIMILHQDNKHRFDGNGTVRQGCVAKKEQEPRASQAD